MTTTHEIQIESLPEKANPAEKPSLLSKLETFALPMFRVVADAARNAFARPELRAGAKTVAVMALNAAHATVAQIRRVAEPRLGGTLSEVIDMHLDVVDDFVKDFHTIMSSDHALQAIKTKVLEYWEIPYHTRTAVMRQKFVDLPATQSRSRDAVHQHAISAANRSNASSTAERLAKVLGLKPIFYQRAAADERKGREGSRVWYWHRDADVSFEPHVVDDATDLICMVDVDYYVDMPLFLNTHFCPVFLYTFAPKQVARVASDYSYWFDPSGQARYVVAGGEQYSHHIWNYNYSSITVTSYFFGVPIRLTTYMVERKYVDADHEMVLLIPLKRWNGITGSLAAFWLEGNPLQRLNVVNGEFAQLRTFGLKGDNLSIGQLGSPIEATLPVAVVQGLEILARTSKYPLSLPSICRHVDNDTTKASLVLSYVNRDVKEKAPIVFPPTEAVRRYQAHSHLFDPSAKPGLQAYMAPIVHEAYAPDNCLGTDIQAVEGRLSKVRPPELPLTQDMSNHIEEFLDLFCRGYERKLHPVDDSVVYERQARPAQRVLLHRAQNLDAKGSNALVKSFVKKEAYGKITDPRIISTVDTPIKRDYSRYMYALEVVFKAAPWYAFGRQPSDIAARVAKVAAESTTLCNTDFSRFDGHGSNVMRELEQCLLHRVFAAEHHVEIFALHRQQYGLRAVTYHGVWYETGYSRLSGSPETSLFNSLVNAFIAYSALRRTKVAGVPMLPAEAYDKLGIYGGDDGLTPDVDTQEYKLAAERFGQELAIEPLTRGELGVKFLARMYGPYVWWGDDNSCCDIKRQASKIHTTVVMPPTIKPLDKLLEKVRAFELTDKNTPVIGDLVRTAMKLYSKENKSPLLKNMAMAAYEIHWQEAEDGKQYPNEEADWMLDVLQQQMPGFDYKRYCKTLQAIELKGKLADLLELPCFVEPTAPTDSKFSVVFEDRVLGPESKEAPIGKPKPIPVRDQSSLPLPTQEKERKAPRPENSSTSASSASGGSRKKDKESFEACKARKVAKGNWKEKAQRASSNRSAAKPQWRAKGKQAT